MAENLREKGKSLMSREIKFRAWFPLNKRMVFESDFKGDGIYGEKTEFWKRRYLNPSYRVMQYTGLKDKNGKEIYEGDIVNVHVDHDNGWKSTVLNTKSKIVWDNELVTWYLPTAFEELGQAHNDRDSTIEVIGNIYENHDLLKGEPNE